jgi:hypothetical protein
MTKPTLENIPMKELLNRFKLSNRDIAALAMVSRTLRTRLKYKTAELHKIHTKKNAKRKNRSPPSGERPAKRARHRL